jgi:GNAT superfamily N-acetyltransferase
MIEIVRTNSENGAFKNLVGLLNLDLAKRDGPAHPLTQFNNISALKYVVLALKNDKPIGCGAIATYKPNTMEIKRMYVSPEVRGQKIGEKILFELENWSRDLGKNTCILFMGSKQPEAHKLYERNGYESIPKYGKLKDILDSFCLAKKI